LSLMIFLISGGICGGQLRDRVLSQHLCPVFDAGGTWGGGGLYRGSETRLFPGYVHGR
jgi:hypothetical protein